MKTNKRHLKNKESILGKKHDYDRLYKYLMAFMLSTMTILIIALLEKFIPEIKLFVLGTLVSMIYIRWLVHAN
jgi:hypothetical protein